MWSKGVLSGHSPQSLIQTMWFLLPQHFGLRGCLEHHNMYVEDFAISTNDNSIEYVTYEETPQKLAKVDFAWNEELFNPRCLLLIDRGALLNFSKHFWNEDPTKCETVAHYLAVNEWPKTQVWYKWQRMGFNSINSFMKNMASQADIQGKKLTNHNAHKTLVKKLRAANQLQWGIICVCQWEVPWRLWRRWWEWTVRHFFHHQCRMCIGTIQQSSSMACKD